MDQVVTGVVGTVKILWIFVVMVGTAVVTYYLVDSSGYLHLTLGISTS